MRSALALGTQRLTPAQAGARAAWYAAQETKIEPWINQVICGDCLDMLRKMPTASVDMVLTDPPYAVRYTDRSGRTIANDDNTRWIFPAFSELYRVLKPDSYCVCFYGWSKIDRFFAAWREIGFHPVGHFVWVKGYASCARHTRMRHEQAYLLAKGNPPLPQDPPSDILEWSYTGNRLHPTQKPVMGLVPIIRSLTRPQDVILDPLCHAQHNAVYVIEIVMWRLMFSRRQNPSSHISERHIILLHDVDRVRRPSVNTTHSLPFLPSVHF
jgi:site-specific DNA-methyltransferase (adenine-specific)